MFQNILFHCFPQTYFILVVKFSLFFVTFDHSYNQTFLDKRIEILKLLEYLHKIYEKAYSNIKTSQDKRCKMYSRNAKFKKLYLKDVVYIKTVGKFKPRYTGPYTVAHKPSPVSVSILRLHNAHDTAFRMHIDRLLFPPPRLWTLI